MHAQSVFSDDLENSVRNSDIYWLQK